MTTKLILSESELAYPERCFARLKESLYQAKRAGKGRIEVVVPEWDTDDDGIIRSGGAIGSSPSSGKTPINNF